MIAGGGIACSCKSSIVSSSTISSFFLGFAGDITFSFYISRVCGSIFTFDKDKSCFSERN